MERIDLLIDRARAGECDLVVKSGSNHGEKSYLYDVASGRFIPRDPIAGELCFNGEPA